MSDDRGIPGSVRTVYEDQESIWGNLHNLEIAEQRILYANRKTPTCGD